MPPPAELPVPEPTAEVQQILEGYLKDLEGGGRPRPDDLIARHPNLAEPLRECLASLEFLHDAALSLRGPHQLKAPVAASDANQLGDFRIVHEVGRGGMGMFTRPSKFPCGGA
jgi:eukaryotic-like serine/threonine-protein kinase